MITTFSRVARKVYIGLPATQYKRVVLHAEQNDMTVAGFCKTALFNFMDRLERLPVGEVRDE